MIRRSLDSRDEEEQAAAIWASQQLVQVDGEFSRAIVTHMVEMLNDPALPLYIHSKLLTTLGKSHASAANDAVDSLQALIKGSILKSPVSSSKTRFAIECCKQLSLISQRIPPVAKQVSLELISVALDDPRAALRVSALKALISLTKHEFLSDLIIDKITLIMSREQAHVRELILCAQLINKASEQNKLERSEFFKLIEIMNNLIVQHGHINLRVELVHSIARLLLQQNRSEEIDELTLENVNTLVIMLSEFESGDDLEKGTILNTCKMTLTEMARLDPSLVNEVYQIVAGHCLTSTVNRRKMELLCFIAWTQIESIESDRNNHYTLLEYLTTKDCTEPELLSAMNLTLIQCKSDTEEEAEKILKLYQKSKHYTKKTLFYVARMCIRYARYRIASKMFELLKSKTSGILSFHLYCYIDCLSRFTEVEDKASRITPVDIKSHVKLLNDAAVVFDEISLEMLNYTAQVWIDCRSVLFRSCSIFLLSSTCTPQVSKQLCIFFYYLSVDVFGRRIATAL